MPLLKKVKQEKKKRQSQVKCVASHWQVCSCHQYCEHNQSTYCEKRKLQWEFFPSVTHRNASRWQPRKARLCERPAYADFPLNLTASYKFNSLINYKFNSLIDLLIFQNFFFSK